VKAPKAGIHAHLVCGKTAAAHCAAAVGNTRHRMQMTTDFARRSARQVTKRQSARDQAVGEPPPNTVRGLGIVIAGDPDPLAAALHDTQALAIAFANRAGPPPHETVTKAITQRGA
jgi:alkanesulfonate monooxygenase SsuD/methylene tetrahydromethanopterin reductase-like flavin-dependent oxidoreductase (luciferase family)